MGVAFQHMYQHVCVKQKMAGHMTEIFMIGHLKISSY